MRGGVKGECGDEAMTVRSGGSMAWIVSENSRQKGLGWEESDNAMV